jgi:putative ABC transport system substrate-binding protein
MLGVDVSFLEARSRAHDELERVFSTARRDRLDGLLVLSDPTLYGGELHVFAIRNRVPMIATKRAFAEGGGLMSYGPHQLDMARRAAYFVDRLLKGARPADLPVEEPSRYELTVNLPTAKALGLTIPPSVLVRAEQAIE